MENMCMKRSEQHITLDSGGGLGKSGYWVNEFQG